MVATAPLTTRFQKVPRIGMRLLILLLVPSLFEGLCGGLSFGGIRRPGPSSLGILPVAPWRQRLPTRRCAAASFEDDGATGSAATHGIAGAAGSDGTVVSMRARIAGVSLSPTGFWAMLECAVPPAATPDASATTPTAPWLLPLCVTRDPRDAAAASSGAALTLLQLLAAPPVDMAGPVLPVEALPGVLVRALEESEGRSEDEGLEDTAAARVVRAHLRDSVARQVRRLRQQFNVSAATAGDGLTYTSQPEWIRARLALPRGTLEEVQLHLRPVAVDGAFPGRSRNRTYDEYQRQAVTMQWKLVARVPELGSAAEGVTVAPSDAVFHEIPWRDEDGVDGAATEDAAAAAAAFVSLALALRYRAPIVVVATEGLLPQQDDDDDNDNDSPFLQDVARFFPLYSGRADVAAPSARAGHQIERGFRVHQLEAALRIALARGDAAAAKKIQARLDDMGSLRDLPVQAESDFDSMQ